MYSCRLGRTVSCTLPFMTNMTISTSISQKFSPLTSNIPSLPVCGVYRTAHTVFQGLLLLGVFYSESSTTFVLASQKIMGYVRIRLKSSLMKVLVDMEISPNIMNPPSLICYRTFWDMIIYSDIRHNSGITDLMISSEICPSHVTLTLTLSVQGNQYLMFTSVFMFVLDGSFFNYIAALQSGHTVLSGFLLIDLFLLSWCKLATGLLITRSDNF